MFNGCMYIIMFTSNESMKELNLSNFNTNNITNMKGIFWGWISLIEFDLSNLILKSGNHE